MAEETPAAAPAELTFATLDDNQKSDLAHSLAVAILYDTKQAVTVRMHIFASRVLFEVIAGGKTMGR